MLRDDPAEPRSSNRITVTGGWTRGGAAGGSIARDRSLGNCTRGDAGDATALRGRCSERDRTAARGGSDTATGSGTGRGGMGRTSGGVRPADPRDDGVARRVDGAGALGAGATLGGTISGGRTALPRDRALEGTGRPSAGVVGAGAAPRPIVPRVEPMAPREPLAAPPGCTTGPGAPVALPPIRPREERAAPREAVPAAAAGSPAGAGAPPISPRDERADPRPDGAAALVPPPLEPRDDRAAPRAG